MAVGKNPYKHFGSKFPGPYMPRGKNPPLLPPGAARKKPKLPKLPGGPVGKNKGGTGGWPGDGNNNPAAHTGAIMKFAKRRMGWTTGLENL